MNFQTMSISNLAELYNSSFTDILDIHAPIRTSNITVRPGCKWFTDDLRDQKCYLWHLEVIKNRTGLVVDIQIYEDAITAYRKSCLKAKKAHFTNEILNAQHDQGLLFRVADNLFHNNSDPVLPSHDSPNDLANNFVTFFNDKVEKESNSHFPHVPVSLPTNSLSSVKKMF